MDVLRPADRPNDEKRRIERQRKALLNDLGRIFNEKGLQSWLDAPTAQLGGRRPEDMLGAPDQQHVVDLIEAVKAGAFS